MKLKTPVPGLMIPLVIALLCSAAFAGVKVVESTPSRLVLLWEMAGFDTVSAAGKGGGLRTLVSYDGGYVNTGDSGAALLHGYSMHVGVPPSGAPRVSVEPVELSAVRLNNPLRRRDFAVDPLEPSFTSRWISDPSYDIMRDYRAARLVLRPVRDLGGGRVQLLKKARIVIDFPPSAHSGASWSPRGDYERMAERLILNFNTAQGWQRAGKRRALGKAAARAAYPFDVNGQKVATFKVGDGNRNGNEGTTKENSLIRIGGASVKRIFGPGVPIGSVALYASTKGEMDEHVPHPDSVISPGIFEVPIIRRDLNGNGIVDDDDYFIAYVSGASDWSYGSRQFNYTLNRYDDYRTYWLAVKNGAGAEMGLFEQPGDAAAEDNDSFEDNLYIRTPTALARISPTKAPEGGTDWTWLRLSMGKADTTLRLDLPGLDGRYPGSVRLNLGSSSGTLGMNLGADTLCSPCGNAWAVVESWNSKDLTVKYRNASMDAKAYAEINGIHVRYRRFIGLTSVAGKLEVFSSNSETVRYRLSNAAGAPAYVVRVPLDEREISLVGKTGEASFTWTDTGNRGVRYMAMLEKNIVDYSDSLKVHAPAPVVNGRFQIRDLRGAANGTDYMIITHGDFLDASLKLAEHKVNMGFENPKVVLLDDVLNQFGGGNTDPAAIRNFMLHVYRNWDGGNALSYLLLVGAGHYDYKYVTTRNVNYMPIPYISGRLNDDFYTFFDTTYHPGSQHNGFYFMGRLPAKSGGEAMAMVEKIIETEDPRAADFDAWRNRVLVSADDDQQGAKIDGILDHHESSERLSAIIGRQRPEIDLRKLYLYEYEWDERHYKPSATRTLINEINSGIALFNWFGHGSIDLIADEQLITTKDVAALRNRKRYPVLALFSCSIGKFDRPGDESITEALIKQPGAGAVAAITSTREVQANSNEFLALPLYEALFDSTGVGVSIGSALKNAKYKYQDIDNRYYVILGDPSLALFGRGRGVELAVTDTAGAKLDTLKALQQVVIKGTVNNNGQKDEKFGGGGAFVNITLFNPPQDSARRKDGGKFTNPVYCLPGSPVFSAKLEVKNGEFEQKLLLPMNLSFGKPGVKLIAYAWKDGEGEAQTAAGHLGGLIFYGSESGSLNSGDGPKITVRPVYNDKAAGMNHAGMFVKNRITSQLPLTVEIGVESENGINTISAGPDEGLTMEIRGALSKRSINHQFKFTEGSYKQGIALVTLEENMLKSGAHEMAVSAQDLLGNVSKMTVALDIVDPAELKLDHIVNIPNPVRMGRKTRFYYHHSNAPGDLNIRVTIRVYSLGGRLLAVIRDPQNGQEWLPADQSGNLLTPNVYLYQVTATSPDIGKTVKSKIKKLAVHPPK